MYTNKNLIVKNITTARIIIYTCIISYVYRTIVHIIYFVSVVSYRRNELPFGCSKRSHASIKSIQKILARMPVSLCHIRHPAVPAWTRDRYRSCALCAKRSRPLWMPGTWLQLSCLWRKCIGISLKSVLCVDKWKFRTKEEVSECIWIVERACALFPAYRFPNETRWIDHSTVNDWTRNISE